MELDNYIYFDNDHSTRTAVTRAFTIVQKTTWSKWTRYPYLLRPGNGFESVRGSCVNDKTITARLFYVKQFSLYRKFFRQFLSPLVKFFTLKAAPVQSHKF